MFNVYQIRDMRFILSLFIEKKNTLTWSKNRGISKKYYNIYGEKALVYENLLYNKHRVGTLHVHIL